MLTYMARSANRWEMDALGPDATPIGPDANDGWNQRGSGWFETSDLPAITPSEAFYLMSREDVPAPGCLAETICGVQNRIRWKRSAWTPAYCGRIAGAILSSAEKHQVAPGLILAVMLLESELDVNAELESHRDGRLFAIDTGLMAMRCRLDDKGRRGKCTNATVKGIPWWDLRQPEVNIERGAHQLAMWRADEGRERLTVKVKGPDGHRITKTKIINCRHKDHAFWAHYNHGQFYFDTGKHRHYPHRVAVLYHALTRALGVAGKDLYGHVITVKDPGQPRRRVGRPVSRRMRKLYQNILESRGPTCGGSGQTLGTVTANARKPDLPQNVAP